MDFATLLVVVSVGVVAMAVVVPVVHRWTRTPQRNAPELAAWADPSRPAKCLRCGGGELVHVRGIQLLSELPGADGPHHLPTGPQRQPMDLEMLVCAACGRAEWFAATPRALERHQRAALPPAANKPYRD